MIAALERVYRDGRPPILGRLVISTGCAALYGWAVAPMAMIVWALVYAAVQVAEDRLIIQPSVAAKRPVVVLSLLAFQSAVFSLPALLLVQSLGPWGMAVGAVHLSAALFSLGFFTRGSRAAYAAAAVPISITMSAYLWLAHQAAPQAAPWALLAGAFLLVVLAATLFWSQGTRSLIAKEQVMEEAMRLRREAEGDAVRLGEAKRLTDLAAHAAGLGYWRYEPGSPRVVWSQEVFRIFGRDEVDGPPDIESAITLFHPEDQAMVGAAFDNSIAHGLPFDFEARLVRADGVERVAVARGLAERDAQGRVRHVIGTILDVTEVREAAHKLAASEELFQELARNTSDMLVRTGIDGRLEYISPAVEIITGFTPEDLIGQETIMTIYEEDRPILVRAVRRAWRSDGPSLGHRVEYRRVHKDGHILWLESCPTPVHDPLTGKVTAIIDTVRDITARKTLEADLVAAREQAEHLATIKSEFLATMSHELRTPLTSIVGFSALVRERPCLDPESKRYLDRVAGAADALMTTVNDILDFSKLEAGQLDIKPEPTDFGQLVADTLGLLRPQADAKDLELSDASGVLQGRSFLLDPARLRQVLLNFLSNAVKFTDAGSVTVSSSLSDDGATLTCAVIDTGLGIPADQSGRLFQRFSQLDGAAYRSKGGSGLGLAICKGLIEAMGGEIGVESTEGLGSRFWFRLPVEEVAAARTSETREAEIGSLLEDVRVLVVDDNDANRDLVRAMLVPLGADIAEAASGPAALSAAAAMPFDLILLDLRMPGMDGHEVLRSLLATPGCNHHTPILAFSADVTDETTPQLVAEGFAGAVSKPINLGQFLRVISDLTASYELAAPNAVA